MKNVIVILFFFSAQLKAQVNSDSLSVVKNYLFELKETVNSKKSKKAKVLKMQRLIHIGGAQREIFARNITRAKSKCEAEEMLRLFNFILQSAILYKNDIKESYSGYSETTFLNANIPILIQRMQ